MNHGHKHPGPANGRNHRELEERQRSEQNWSNFLNATLGVLGFPLGLACLTTKTPSINGALCLVFLIVIWFNNRRLIPKHFLEPSKTRPFWRAWRNNSKFWLGTAPALLGYFYLSFVTFSHPIAIACTTKYRCQWFAAGVNYYVGPP